MHYIAPKCKVLILIQLPVTGGYIKLMDRQKGYNPIAIVPIQEPLETNKRIVVC